MTIATFLNQERLKQSGFQRGSGNANSGYVLMSDHQCGRRVYISLAAAPLFQQIINGDGFEGQMLLSKLSQLRATSGGMTSYSDTQDAFHHVQRIGNFQVVYYMVQAGGDSGLNPGVYITALDYLNKIKGKEAAGLYKITNRKNEWAVEDKSLPSIDTSIAAINGLTENIDAAAKEIMPAMIEKAWQEKHKNYNLFYNPPSLYTLGRVFKTPKQKQQSFPSCAKKLASVLDNTQKQLNHQAKDKQVRWLVHGDGALLLKEALNQLPAKQSLNRHSVLLAAPSGDVSSLLRQMREQGMALDTQAVKYNPEDYRNIAVRCSNKISDQVRLFGEDYHKRAGEIKYEAIDARKSVASIAGTMISLTSLKWPQVVMNARGIANSIRNMAANHTDNASLNPHMHPFHDRNEFNAKVDLEHNGTIRSMTSLVTGRTYA